MAISALPVSRYATQALMTVATMRQLMVFWRLRFRDLFLWNMTEMR